MRLAAAARYRLAFSGVLWQHGGAARGVESVACCRRQCSE
jgi:hypothetical protein